MKLTKEYITNMIKEELTKVQQKRKKKLEKELEDLEHT
tara:strand:+ start:279 stop:392 length:114 start_codon:yes stop_codon:yes gene_type:complete